MSRAEKSSDLLARIAGGVGPEVLSEAEKSLDRLAQRCRRRPLGRCHILLPFGGGKDSGFTLAYLRLMQLLRRERSGSTFQLHVLFVVHPGVTAGVYQNVQELFRSLEIPGDEDIRVACLTLGGQPLPLELGAMGEGLVELFRQDVLLSGHLSQGNGRETFCNSCNFNMMNAVTRYVLGLEGEIDFVVTGDSRDEVLAYWKWTQRTASLFGLQRIGKQQAGWSGMVSKLSEISDAYYGGLFGTGSAEGTAYAFPNLGNSRREIHPPEYFGVFGDTRYEYWAHSAFLESLGFRLREDSFNFTESDCRNPLLMAHLRGLLADFEGRGYVTGVREYLRLVTHLMERKSYSLEMIELALAPYQDEEGILRRRYEAEEHAFRQYRITPPQLAAVVASPLTDSLERLDPWLRWSHPERLSLSGSLRAYLEALHRGPASGDGDLAGFEAAAAFAGEAFGLSPRAMRLLLQRRSVSRATAGGCCGSALEIMRQGDPHKMALDDEPGHANNLITGR